MSDKPKIFVISQPAFGGEDLIGTALAEDGHAIAGHCSSSVGFLRHDMGFTSDWKHEHYDKHYPQGWQLVDLIEVRNLADVPEYMAALAKNRALEKSSVSGGGPSA